MCVTQGEGQKADAVLHCTVLPTALTTDLSAQRERERLISLRGPEGFITISQQTIIMSLEGRKTHVHTHIHSWPHTQTFYGSYCNTPLTKVWEN